MQTDASVMMDRVSKHLEEARDELVSCAGQRLKSGDAGGVRIAEKLFGLAKDLQHLLERCRKASSQESVVVGDVPKTARLFSEDPLAEGDAMPRTAQPRKKEYPIYSRRGDVLIKTGWSPKHRAEYVPQGP